MNTEFNYSNGSIDGSQNTTAQSFVINSFVNLIINRLFGSKSSGKGVVGDRNLQDGIIYKIYKGIIQSFEYRAVYYLVVVLYITILGVTYLLGMSPLTMEKIIPSVIKIGVIAMFTNPSVLSGGLPIGWDYYNSFIVSPSLRAMEQFAIYFCATLFNWNISNVDDGFIPLTVVFGMLLNGSFWMKCISLIFTNVLMGLPTFLMVLFVMVLFFMMMLFGIVAYITSLVMLGMLFALGPFFFLFMMFDRTKNFFTKWMSNVISLMLQQYTLFITIAIFGFIISQNIESMLDFQVKCTPIIEFNLRIPILKEIQKVCRWFGSSCEQIRFTYPLFSYYTMATNDNSTFLTLFMYAIFLYMLIKLFGAMVEYTAMLGHDLVPGSVSASKGGANRIAEAGEKFAGFVEKHAVGKRADKATIGFAKHSIKASLPYKVMKRLSKSSNDKDGKSDKKSPSDGRENFDSTGMDETKATLEKSNNTNSPIGPKVNSKKTQQKE